VKKALVIAHEQKHNYDTLLSRVKGIVFMGTPHRGSKAASWSRILTDIVDISIAHSTTRRELTKSLTRNSTDLFEIGEQFMDHAKELRLLSFYEKKRTRLLNALVVEKDSAVLQLPNEIDVAGQADHRHMVRFETIRSPEFDAVWKPIKKMVDSLASTAPAPWRPGSATPGSPRNPERMANGVAQTPDASMAGLLKKLFYADSETEIKIILDEEGLTRPPERPGIRYPEIDRLHLTVKTLLNLAHEMDEMIARIVESEKRR